MKKRNSNQQILDNFIKTDTKFIPTSQKEKIINFVSQHLDEFPEGYLPFIFENIDENVYTQEIAVVRQILDASGLYEDNSKNPYLQHLKIFEDFFTYNQNIVDVGSGIYPATAVRIKEKQIDGTLTVYEPNILTFNRSDIIFRKEEFTLQTNIDNEDLLFGLYPCQATEAMILKANKEHKNLFLAMCGCSHYDDFEILFYGKNPHNWKNDMIQLFKRTSKDDCEIKIIEQNDKKNIKYPILIKKLKK